MLKAFPFISTHTHAYTSTHILYTFWAFIIWQKISTGLKPDRWRQPICDTFVICMMVLLFHNGIHVYELYSYVERKWVAVVVVCVYKITFGSVPLNQFAVITFDTHFAYVPPWLIDWLRQAGLTASMLGSQTRTLPRRQTLGCAAKIDPIYCKPDVSALNVAQKLEWLELPLVPRLSDMYSLV